MMAFVGCVLVAMGLDYLRTGLIPQRWGGGPPLEGSLAHFGALFIAISGAFIAFVSLFKKQNNHVDSDDHQQT